MRKIEKSVPTRRFGRTDLDIPVLSLGGMRFQQSWTDISSEEISTSNQMNVEHILQYGKNFGLHHIETARHYGTSELQLGFGLKNVFDSKRILQTKIPPRQDPIEFEKELQTSFKRLQCEKVDLLAIHGLNLPEHLDQTIRPGGCLDVVRRWQQEDRVGHVGFSTHGPTELIVRAIETEEFDYVNLHWYFIFQDNEPVLEVAKKLDLGVFIISPTDKGGHLHSPPSKLLKLCAPLHPIVFNDLFCLSDRRVHTLSIGASKPQDLNLHLEAIKLLDKSDSLVSKIEKNLINASLVSLGKEWTTTWHQGLPKWEETPGNINIPVLLWLYNLIQSWDMEDYAKARYRLLGNGSHWFPGSNADSFDSEVSEQDIKQVLQNSPWINDIPTVLRQLKDQLSGKSVQRLSNV